MVGYLGYKDIVKRLEVVKDSTLFIILPFFSLNSRDFLIPSALILL